MASDSELPTWTEIERHALDHLDEARRALSGVRDWLISDWRPLGSPLSDSAAEARSEVLRIVGQMKGLIDQAKELLQREDGDG